MVPTRKTLIVSLLAMGLAPGWASASEGRAFWLTRWNARDEGQIVSALDGMAALNANMVFCQVYGDAMALYRSDFVPRSPLVSGDFDALATAVEEGHVRGIQVHAYINVCNVWSGGLGTPSDPDHIVRAHPEWAVVDAAGNSDADLVGVADTLIFFCPEWKGFREYAVRVAEEIAERYEVDGIHLDYLRYPVGNPRCFCSAHRANFTARFGRPPADDDPDFIEWRFANITDLFGEIQSAVAAVQPGIMVSASLVAPSGRYFQDARRILEAGNLDAAVPLIYAADVPLFEERARYFHENSGGRLVFAGISADCGRLGEEIAAARSIGLEGQAFFSWSTLDDPGRADLLELYPTNVPPPAMPWKDGSRDVAPPVISGVRAAGIEGTEATILWHSDEAARARVDFGLTTALGTTVESPAFSFDHAVRIGGLAPETTYRYRVTSTDPSGNSSRSGIQTFATTSASAGEFIVDDGGDGFSSGGPWSPGSSPGGFDGDYIFSSEHDQETAWAEFRPFLPAAGAHEVAVWYVAGSNRVGNARFTVVHSGGTQTFEVNQKTNGGRWNVLGEFPFLPGDDGYVRLSNRASGGDVVIADAVRFRRVPSGATFVRGDSRGDGTLDIADAVSILLYLFAGRSGPACLDSADVDDDGDVRVSDPIFLLSFLFRSGPRPPPPYPQAGADPTPDTLVDC